MGLPSFPTSRWLDPGHQISVCLDMKFLSFNHGGSDVWKNHFAQSWTKAGKAENEDLGVPFSALFLNLYLRKTVLPCKHSSRAPALAHQAGIAEPVDIPSLLPCARLIVASSAPPLSWTPCLLQQNVHVGVLYALDRPKSNLLLFGLLTRG